MDGRPHRNFRLRNHNTCQRRRFKFCSARNRTNIHTLDKLSSSLGNWQCHPPCPSLQSNRQHACNPGGQKHSVTAPRAGLAGQLRGTTRMTYPAECFHRRHSFRSYSQRARQSRSLTLHTPSLNPLYPACPTVPIASTAPPDSGQHGGSTWRTIAPATCRGSEGDCARSRPRPRGREYGGQASTNRPLAIVWVCSRSPVWVSWLGCVDGTRC